MRKLFVIFFIVVSLSGINAQQWVEQVQPSPQRPLRSVSAVDGSVVWAGGDQGTVLYTSNSGTNWIFRGGGQLGNNNVYAITGISSTSALCAVNSITFGYIYRTTNSGINWTLVFSKSGGFINDVKSISFVNSTFFAYGNPIGGRWLLLKSTNGGITFDTAGLRLNQSGTEIGWPNALAVMGNNVWFGTNNSRIYRSTNGGTTWSMAPIAVQNIFSIAFNSTFGIAAGDLGFFTTNSGINWTVQINLPGNGVLNAVNNTNANFWYCRGTNIYYSSNNGASFNIQYTSPSAGVFRHLSFVTSVNDNILTTIRGWGVTNNGAISHYSDPTGIIKISGEIPVKFFLYQNYPNPFNPETKIRFDLPAASGVLLKIYNVKGEEIASLLNASLLSPGSYELSWDGSMFSSGVYFCRLTAGKYSEITKMVLIK